MSNLRLKAIPAALAAAGFLSIGSVYAADQATGTPQPGVYAQGTFAPSAYAVATRNLYAPLGTDSATATGGFIFVALKPTQTAWGYALTDSNFSNARGTHTLTHTLTTGTNTCSATYVVSYDAAGIMSVSYAAATSSLYTTTATTAGLSACRTAFSNQTGITTKTFEGGQAVKAYSLIY